MRFVFGHSLGGLCVILARLLDSGRLLSDATAFLRCLPFLIAVVAIGIFELA